MLGLTPLVPAFCLLGFVVLALAGRHLSSRLVALVGCGAVALSMLTAFVVAGRFIVSPPPGFAHADTLWIWLRVGDFAPRIAFRLDSLAVVMVLVVVVVSLLIHVYSVEFMAADDGYSRFFAYMNLFVGSMLTLVLADDLLLLYLGWEGVGLSSYLLIGFWYRDPINGAAARKAFIVTRVGDAAMALGLVLIVTDLGTLAIPEMNRRALAAWPIGSAPATAAAALLLAGALGKSAQLPLQTWLPDAMAGPTPVSALIHAATMVTAGVYLIARTHVLYTLAPAVHTAVAVIGAVTLLVAAGSALVQRDIKRVLAYSTMSQIGYMFLALGVGAWSAAIFHLMTHAFFKALLFLAAGVVIKALHEEHDIFRMGGLRRQLPVAFWTFLVAGASLAGFPLVTAGFYSKGLILWRAWASDPAGTWLWMAGWVGAVLTAVYIFRVIFVVFFGEARGRVERMPGATTVVVLLVLAVFSIGVGFVDLPPILGDPPALDHFLQTSLPPAPAARTGGELALELLAIVAALLGIALAYLAFLARPAWTAGLAGTPIGAGLHRFWFSGWGFDWLYDRLLVRPFLWLARVNRFDAVDLVYVGLARALALGHRELRRSETGRVRWYAGAIAGGAIVIVAIAVLV